MAERLVAATKAKEDSVLLALRPKSFDEFMGQEQVKFTLLQAIRSAKEKKEQLEHILFAGPPGLGKSTLAWLVANELNLPLTETIGQYIAKAADVSRLFETRGRRVIFIDEIHSIKALGEEALYHAMEDLKLQVKMGKYYTATYKLEPFTLIGATTKLGRLSQPLRDRFGISYILDFYPEEIITLIVKNSAKKLNMTITDDAVAELVKRSRNVPRIANRLLRRIRDFHSNVDKQIVIDTLLSWGIDEHGLDDLDRRYLKALVFAGTAVGVEHLASALVEDRKTIEDVIEPYLLRSGLVLRTTKGRVATAKAIEMFIPANSRLEKVMSNR